MADRRRPDQGRVEIGLWKKLRTGLELLEERPGSRGAVLSFAARASQERIEGKLLHVEVVRAAEDLPDRLLRLRIGRGGGQGLERDGQHDRVFLPEEADHRSEERRVG